MGRREGRETDRAPETPPTDSLSWVSQLLRGPSSPAAESKQTEGLGEARAHAMPFLLEGLSGLEQNPRLGSSDSPLAGSCGPKHHRHCHHNYGKLLYRPPCQHPSDSLLGADSPAGMPLTILPQLSSDAVTLSRGRWLSREPPQLLGSPRWARACQHSHPNFYNSTEAPAFSSPPKCRPSSKQALPIPAAGCSGLDMQDSKVLLVPEGTEDRVQDGQEGGGHSW